MRFRGLLLVCLPVFLLACEDDPVGPMHGQIDVTAWASGVQVSGPGVILDGVSTDLLAPSSLSHLDLGRHVVRLDVAGYATDPPEAVVHLDHGEAEEAPFELVPPDTSSGFLWVTSQPTGATVVVSGSDTGELTPAVMALRADTTYVTVTKAGFTVEPSGPQVVEVVAGEVVHVAFTLIPEQNGTTTRVVLAELFTATWCEYCPYSEEAIDRLGDEYGAGLLAVVQYHPTWADPFGTTETHARGDWYECWSALPQIYFDGVVNLQHDFEETYDEYKAVVDSLLSVPAELELDLDAAIDGDSLRVSVTISPVGQVGGAVVCRVAVCEDNLEFTAPNGQTHFRYTVRDMLPPWDVQLVGELSRDWSVGLDASWKKEDLGVVAFVQDTSTREVLQAARHDL